MTKRPGPLCLLLAIGTAMAGDGISPRPSANSYPAHAVSGKLTFGAAYVTPVQVRKLFGDDLDRRGYVVFEVGMFPADTQVDISADDFKLRQGKDPSILRALSPHDVAASVHPTKTTQPRMPDSRLPNVYTSDTIGYGTGSNGRGGVYTDSRVNVNNYPAPPQPPATSNDQTGLQQLLEEKALPEGKTNQRVAGYIFFPKPSADKRADFELIYFGQDGQVSLKLSPTAKP
jgi:hypothetical protein